MNLLALALAAAPLLTPDVKGNQKLLKQKDALDHLSVVAIDEVCAEKVQLLGSPQGTGLEAFGTQSASMHSVTSSGAKPAPFADFKAWTDKQFAADRKPIYGLNVMDDHVYGFKAECALPTPVLASDELIHLVHKDKNKPETSFRMGLDAPALGKLRALPKETLRIAVVYDGTLLLKNVRVEDLRNLDGETAELTVLEFKK